MPYYPKQLTRSGRSPSGPFTETITVTNAANHLKAEQVGFRDPSGFVLSGTFGRLMKDAKGNVLVASHPRAHDDYERDGFTDPGADIA